MKVSFVITHSFIPAWVAKALKAERVGGIDFTLLPLPKPKEGFPVPAHLAFYRMNRTKQTKFPIVCIEPFDLGVGPVSHLCSMTRMQISGLWKMTGGQLKVGNKGFADEAASRLHFMELPEPKKMRRYDLRACENG